jgi:hypothetical protein
VALRPTLSNGLPLSGVFLIVLLFFGSPPLLNQIADCTSSMGNKQSFPPPVLKRHKMAMLHLPNKKAGSENIWFDISATRLSR